MKNCEAFEGVRVRLTRDDTRNYRGSMRGENSELGCLKIPKGSTGTIIRKLNTKHIDRDVVVSFDCFPDATLTCSFGHVRGHFISTQDLEIDFDTDEDFATDNDDVFMQMLRGVYHG